MGAPPSATARLCRPQATLVHRPSVASSLKTLCQGTKILIPRVNGDASRKAVMPGFWKSPCMRSPSSQTEIAPQTIHSGTALMAPVLCRSSSKNQKLFEESAWPLSGEEALRWGLPHRKFPQAPVASEGAALDSFQPGPPLPCAHLQVQSPPPLTGH